MYRRNLVFNIVFVIVFVLCNQHKAYADYVVNRDSLVNDINVSESMSDTSNVFIDGASDVSVKTKKPFLKKVGWCLDRLNNFFMGCDTSYVTPQLYEITTQAELSYWHDYYRISSSETGNTNYMTLQSGNPLILGGYIYWGFFGYGHSVNLDDVGNPYRTAGSGTRNSFTLNTARIMAEIYTFKSGQKAHFSHISGVRLNNEDRDFSGLSSKCVGFDAQYIFNHKRYSWPAAFGENAVQRRSQGSWKLGISFNRIDVNFDRSQLSSHVKANVDTTMLFNRIGYNDYAVSFGYGYNFVFLKNCLLAVSVLPSLGYRQTKITEIDNDRDILRNISTDVFFRASLFWNNTKCFSGIVVDFHTYSYQRRKFGLTNTYGTIKYILGMNIIKKSQYRRKHDNYDCE